MLLDQFSTTWYRVFFSTTNSMLYYGYRHHPITTALKFIQTLQVISVEKVDLCTQFPSPNY